MNKDLSIILKITVEFCLLIIIVLFTIREAIKIYKDIRNYIKNREQYNKDDRTIFEYFVGLLLFIGATYLLDRYNLFQKLGLTVDLNKDYDWLSFIGNCIAAITGALVLIFVTRKDRKENTVTVYNAQRPYINVDFEQFEGKEIRNDSFAYVLSGDVEEKYESPMLIIQNVGQTAAIIDVQKSYVKVRYHFVKDVSEEKVEEEEKEKIIFFDSVLKRIAIASNKTVNICFFDEDFFIKEYFSKEVIIDECDIFYSDLFGERYEDKSIYKDKKIEVLINNQRL